MRKKNKKDDEDNILKEYLIKITKKCIYALQSKEKKIGSCRY